MIKPQLNNCKAQQFSEGKASLWLLEESFSCVKVKDRYIVFYSYIKLNFIRDINTIYQVLLRFSGYIL